MDSGLARFVVLVVLFFLLTGDLAGMVKHVFEETVHGGGGGDGGKRQQTSAATGPPIRQGGRSAAAAAAADKRAANEEDADDIKEFAKTYSARMKLINTIKESCLPKMICELTASPNRDSLTESERYLLSLIRETTISTTAELTSKYHFAAHMGQLINGIDNTGCHNFYPGCPFPGLQVMQMMKKVKIL